MLEGHLGSLPLEGHLGLEDHLGSPTSKGLAWKPKPTDVYDLVNTVAGAAEHVIAVKPEVLEEAIRTALRNHAKGENVTTLKLHDIAEKQFVLWVGARATYSIHFVLAIASTVRRASSIDMRSSCGGA